MTMRAFAVLRVSALAFMAACSRPSNDGGSGDAANGANLARVDAASRSDSGSAANAVGVGTYAGTYVSQQSTLTVPEGAEWKGVKFRGEESPLGLGEGPMELIVDTSGRAHGTVMGQLGPALVTGVFSSGVVAGTVYRKDPSDNGFTGSFYAKLAGDTFTGELKVSSGNGAILRDAKISLRSKEAK